MLSEWSLSWNPQVMYNSNCAALFFLVWLLTQTQGLFTHFLHTQLKQLFQRKENS